MADIKIDTKVFQERITHLATAWKNDQRGSNGIFNGATSMLVMMGKVEEVPELHKNNAMHVSQPTAQERLQHLRRDQETNAWSSFGSSATNFRRL